MARVRFTQNIQRHIACPPCDVVARTVSEALDAALANNVKARDYFLDDQGALRKHIAIFVDGVPMHDRVKLSDPIEPDALIDVMQALSGG